MGTDPLCAARDGRSHTVFGIQAGISGVMELEMRDDGSGTVCPVCIEQAATGCSRH